MELDFEDLVGFLDLVGLNEPFDGQERSLDSIIGDRLLVHELVDVEMRILLLHGVRDVVGQVGF